MLGWVAHLFDVCTNKNRYELWCSAEMRPRANLVKHLWLRLSGERIQARMWMIGFGRVRKVLVH